MGTAAYDKEHTTRVNLKLNNKTDADIIQRLHEVPSIQGYIKTLIRNDMMIEEDDTMMTAYHIKSEYLSNWGEDTTTETVITQDELERLASAWGTTVDELLPQLIETEIHRISIDNGAHYVTPEEAVKGMAWEVIVNYMDDDTREAVAQEGYDDEVTFLARYLELADDDLIIG